MWGLNKKCPSGFAQPIGRIPGEQDLPWDAVSITQIQRTGLENPDFGSVFVRGCAEAVEATTAPRHRHPGDLEPADSGGIERAVSNKVELFADQHVRPDTGHPQEAPPAPANP